MKKLTKTFKTVNYIEQAGDAYARWSAESSKHIKDAVMLTVTDESGAVIFNTVQSKGGYLTKTLADCRSNCLAQFRVWGPK